MPTIKYCPASVFLSDYLPEEIISKVQRLTGGGSRVMLYWHTNVVENKDGDNIFFKEFGRVYLGDSNTNEPHEKYIRLTLEAIHRALKKMHITPSFEVEEIMKRIPWKEKEKTSAWETYLSDDN